LEGGSFLRDPSWKVLKSAMNITNLSYTGVLLVFLGCINQKLLIEQWFAILIFTSSFQK
jgi:hypothetical protein